MSLQLLSALFLRHGLSLNLELTDWLDWLANELHLPILAPPSPSPGLGLQTHAAF